MPRIKLTDTAVRNLTVAKGIVDYWDTGMPGLCLRVRESGHKAFSVRYRVGSRQRRFSLGTYPVLSLSEARSKARSALADVARGRDPQAIQRERRDSDTFGQLAADYLELHAKPKKRTWQDDARILDKDLLPAWGDWKARSVSRRDVVDLLDRIVARGAPVMANRTRSLVSKVFAFGLEREVVEINPVLGIKPRVRETSRDRVLSDEEIAALWCRWSRSSSAASRVLRLLLVTAQRSREVSTMRWQDIDGDTWTIPAEKSKNQRSHAVPLSPLAQRLIETAYRNSETWVFSVRDDRPVRWLSHSARRDAEATGILHWTPHDLRRTAATRLAMLGTPREVVGKILNHTETGATAIYVRASYHQEMREALNTWADELSRLVR